MGEDLAPTTNQLSEGQSELVAADKVEEEVDALVGVAHVEEDGEEQLVHRHLAGVPAHVRALGVRRSVSILGGNNTNLARHKVHDCKLYQRYIL